MRRWALLVSSIVGVATACSRPVNTVPGPVSPSASIQFYDLEVPSDLEIKAVDFTATSFTDVYGFEGSTGSSTSARGFIKVYAIQRRTGEQFLLVYEDVARRKKPVQVIHFRATSDVVLPGG